MSISNSARKQIRSFLKMPTYSNEDASEPNTCYLLTFSKYGGICLKYQKFQTLNTVCESTSKYLKSNHYKIISFLIINLYKNPNPHLSFRLSSWSCCFETKQKEQQLIGHFFSDHPRRIQLQHCLEISEITVYLRKKQSEPIWFPALTGDTSL